MIPFIEEVRRFLGGPLIVGGGIGAGKAFRGGENLGAHHGLCLCGQR